MTQFNAVAQRMNDPIKRTYWRGPVDRGQENGATADTSADLAPASLSRRRFLEAAGFTLSAAAIGGCDRMRAPVENILPYVQQPNTVVPGKTRYYASTCDGCTAACGLLVGVRDGRPLKMEGMPEHPLSQGGLCAVGQAAPLGLYDSARLTGPLAAGQPAEWPTVDRAILAQLKRIAGQKEQGAVRLVTRTITSPTLGAAIDAFLGQFSDARHVVIDPVSCSAILDAHQATHGVRLLPHYDFKRAETIVSFGADFLGNWISPVEYTAGWRAGRVPGAGGAADPHMSYHVQFEARLSLTGSNADRRFTIRPEEEPLVLSHLAVEVARRCGDDWPDATLADCPVSAEAMEELATRLVAAHGASLVVSASNQRRVQILVNYVNHLLGNYGSTIDIGRPSRQRLGNDHDLLTLLDELNSGQVAALVVGQVDLLHDLPGGRGLSDAIRQVPLVISLAPRKHATAELAHFVCPESHGLETWLDAEPVSGIVSICQPTLERLGNTRSMLESLATWNGRPATAYDLVRSHWREKIAPRAASSQPFTQFWDNAVRRGVVEIATAATKPGPFRREAVQLAGQAVNAADYSLVLYTKTAMPDSRHAYNPWLHELPDPVTKVTWDNTACLSPRAAERLGVRTGDVVRVTLPDRDVQLELPVYVQPGQHDRVVAIALAYGVPGTERFARIGPQWFEARSTVGANGLVGTNAAPLLETIEHAVRYTRSGIQLVATGHRHKLATTQEHNSMDVPANVAPYGAERRDPIQETTFDAYRDDPTSGGHHGREVKDDASMWPDDHPMMGHHWGMVVDLNACTGCSACVVACQSENNVPVVGRDEVYRQREMHWIRIDRYFSGQGNALDVTHQPMMCQHCDHAPCETVCPVLATVHSDEGLNQQIYNRCVGTRYCANNCPYKVRRFNWFKYAHDDPLQNLALNPDVTVRSRGVMEKCSMCVQRIEHARIEARGRGQQIVDGAVQTACQQSCPARAIVFGDLNDPQSHVRAARDNPRRYRVLEELGVDPSVAYLRVVRNRATLGPSVEEETHRG